MPSKWSFQYDFKKRCYIAVPHRLGTHSSSAVRFLDFASVTFVIVESRGTSKSEDLTVKAIPAFDRGIFLVIFKVFSISDSKWTFSDSWWSCSPGSWEWNISDFCKVFVRGGFVLSKLALESVYDFSEQLHDEKALNWKILSWEKVVFLKMRIPLNLRITIFP